LKKIQELTPESKKTWPDWKTFEDGSVGRVAIKNFVQSREYGEEVERLVKDREGWDAWANANRGSDEGNEKILYAIITMEALELGGAPDRIAAELKSPDLLKGSATSVAGTVADFYKDEEKAAAFKEGFGGSETMLREE
jgi:hypothetical protein